MRPFRYARPHTLDQALRVLIEHGSTATLLAGGTDVIVRLRLGHIAPAIVVDLKNISELPSDIVEIEGRFRIGARAVMTDILADARIQRHFPALIEAASVVGSVQIRNRATLAGNICNASPAADTAPALLVYGAVVTIVGSGGTRRVPLTEFFMGPGRTVLQRSELVESIDLPIPSKPTGAAFGRVTRRRGVDLATINLCCLVTAAGETRLAFGAVGPRPFMVEDVDGILASDSEQNQQSRDALLEGLIGQATPISDVRAGLEYRAAMLGVMSRRTLKIATSRLRQAQAGA